MTMDACAVVEEDTRVEPAEAHAIRPGAIEDEMAAAVDRKAAGETVVQSRTQHARVRS